MAAATQPSFTTDLKNFFPPFLTFHPKSTTDTFTILSTTLLFLTILNPLTRIFRHIRRDYAAYLSLGPGGTPSTPLGFLKIAYLRLFTLRNPLIAPPLTLSTKPPIGYLRALTPRSGFRPTVKGIAPQRQTSQRAPSEALLALRSHLLELEKQYPYHLRTGISCFEKHGLSLNFAPYSPEQVTQNACQQLNPTCRDSGEICHVHAIDGSMHVVLHPMDVKLVIERGWGERHPLAGGGWFGQRWVPSGFVLLYAPRTVKEVDVHKKVVQAGVWWVGGVDLQEDLKADQSW